MAYGKWRSPAVRWCSMNSYTITFTFAFTDFGTNYATTNRKHDRVRLSFIPRHRQTERGRGVMRKPRSALHRVVKNVIYHSHINDWLGQPSCRPIDPYTAFLSSKLWNTSKVEGPDIYIPVTTAYRKTRAAAVYSAKWRTDYWPALAVGSTAQLAAAHCANEWYARPTCTCSLSYSVSQHTYFSCYFVS